jgi:hypothetical protein
VKPSAARRSLQQLATSRLQRAGPEKRDDAFCRALQEIRAAHWEGARRYLRLRLAMQLLEERERFALEDMLSLVDEAESKGFTHEQTKVLFVGVIGNDVIKL